ncbi:MAG: RDD family protein [Candidatus Gracilibacteria bacterium]|nr:RDD family protein [Candidatus Gracilibacteria bacterium]
MDEDRINKIANWIKANKNYPAEEIRQSALEGGTSEEEFDAALEIANKPVIMALEYKGVGIRFLALIIDTILFGILFSQFMKLFGASYIGGCSSSASIGSSITVMGNKTFYGLCGFSAQLYFLVIFTYYVLFEWKFGGTIGKLITGMRVMKSTGEPLDLKDSLIRNIMRIIDFLPFFYLAGSISIWNSKTKQRIGDRLAKTVVVSKYSNK